MSLLAPGQHDQAVGEEQGEHGERPVVDEGADDDVDAPVGEGAVDGPPARSELAAGDVDDAVRQRYAQQGDAPREVRGQGAFLLGDRTTDRRLHGPDRAR